MHGWIDACMDRCMDRCMHGWIDACMDGQINRLILPDPTSLPVTAPPLSFLYIPTSQNICSSITPLPNQSAVLSSHWIWDSIIPWVFLRLFLNKVGSTHLALCSHLGVRPPISVGQGSVLPEASWLSICLATLLHKGPLVFSLQHGRLSGGAMTC